MGNLIEASWMHRGYGSMSGYGYHHAYGGGSWIAHMVVSSIIHGLIYGVIFRLLSHLSLSEIVLLAALVIGGLYVWSRNRRYGNW